MAELEEDWFYDSISRYKNLNMFELEYPVRHMELTDTNSICVSCSNQKRHQLLELSLPLKLTSKGNNSQQAVITSDTDLKIRCGTFTNAEVTHMKTMNNDRKLVASHLKTYGVTLYNFSPDDSDEIRKELVIKCELESPSLALSGTELVLTKNMASPTLVMDLNTGQKIRNIVCDESSTTKDGLLTPVFVDSRQLALSNQSTGEVLLYDSRDFKLLRKVPAPVEKGSLWSFSSLYECSEKSSNSIHSTYFAMVSSCGKLNIYDSRNWNSLCISKSLALSTVNEPRVRLNSSEKCSVSVSGFDGNVYVYQLAPELELVFVHDGHRHVEGFASETTTSAHVWFPGIDNLIISSADNGSVQSWRFEDDQKNDRVVR